HAIIAGEAFRVGETQVLPFRQEHGVVDSVGYRIGDFAYSTDVKTLPDDAFKALEGVKLWVVDCQGYEPFYTHAHLELTLSWIAKVKPQLAVLTHMGHGLDYETLKRELPDGIVPAYDNMVVDNIA
ncbi:MAG: MBL fold metallo-hydrolase, partial [Hyphomicrobiales bacterium]|nr:MBL fold metallo-hydrolase [Hyphomicrobiales bacterium]